MPFWVQLLLSLVTGLIDALPQLIQAAIELVLNLVTGLLKMLPKLIEAGIELVVSLIVGLVTAIPKIIEMLPQIVEAIWNGLIGVDWLDLGVQIVMGIINGLGSMVGALVDAIVDLAGAAFDGFKDFFGIKSPSKLMRSTTKHVVEGASLGVDDEAPEFAKSMVDMAKKASVKAQAAMGTVTATVATATAARTLAASQAAAAGAGGGGGTSVTQNFDITVPETDPNVLAERVGIVAERKLAGVL